MASLLAYFHPVKQSEVKERMNVYSVSIEVAIDRGSEISLVRTARAMEIDIIRLNRPFCYLFTILLGFLYYYNNYVKTVNRYRTNPNRIFTKLDVSTEPNLLFLKHPQYFLSIRHSFPLRFTILILPSLSLQNHNFSIRIELYRRIYTDYKRFQFVFDNNNRLYARAVSSSTERCRI